MWDVCKDAIFLCIQFFYTIFGDWGMAIIIITLIFRAAITPLAFAQAKSSYQMTKMQPMMNAVRERFADDPVRQNEEMQKIYAEAKFNPLAGCIPMLIQMPIFVALFQVLRSMGERVQGTSYEFYNLVPDLTMTPSDAFGMGISTFIPYVILMIIFAGATFVPMLLQQSSQPQQQRNQTLLMSGVMSLFMLWISWGSPAGVLLFWGTSSILAICQQQGSRYFLKKKDEEVEEEIELQPVQVEVTRKQKKKRQHKKH